MKLVSGRMGIVVIGCWAALGCVVCDSDDNSSSSVPPPVSIPLRGMWPCIGPIGTEVTVYSTNASPAASVSVGGRAAFFTARTTKSLTFNVPTGGATGPIVAHDAFGRASGQTPEQFVVGNDDPVQEVEPNEDINGGDATPMFQRTRGLGNLANPADRDHFLRNCFMVGGRYSVTVTPRVVGTVFVNGTGVPLDANGRGEFNASHMSMLFGLTGGTGPYTMTIGFVSPPP